MAIDLRELELELQRSTGIMDKWAESLQSEALDTRDRHIMTTEDQAGIDTEHAEADTLNSNERDAKDQSTALRKQLDQLRRELAVAQEQQDHRMADHALEEGLRQKRMQALRTAVSVYSTRLGLEFKQGPEELELVFTQIDTHDPERQFCFAVRILPDNSYQVTRCQPEVEQVSALLLQLNSSNNFAAFVQALRAAFQSMCVEQ
ncbi:MAG: hypothetical protein WDW38_002906 [Sanguina aurantia]